MSETFKFDHTIDWWVTRDGRRVKFIQISHDALEFSHGMVWKDTGLQYLASSNKITDDDVIGPFKDSMFKTVKTLIPGYYGRVKVLDKAIAGTIPVSFTNFGRANLSAQDFRETAATFIKLAEYLEEME